MSAQSPRRASTALLSIPLAMITGAASVMRSAFGRTASADIALDVAQPVPEVSAIRKYEIADRVHSHQFGSTQVSFYLYVRKDIIRAIARKDKRTKEIDFTPQLADKFDVPFNMDGAIVFIRANGFTQGRIAGNPRKVAAALPAALAPATPPWEDPASPAASVQQPVEPKRKQHNSQSQQVVSSNRSRPFTGRILSMGESIRPGRNGSAPYSTFAVKLQSESGSFEREFLGEHLAELADKHDLKVGNVIQLQLLGRNRFDVIIDGKSEERWRNEYALSVLS